VAAQETTSHRPTTARSAVLTGPGTTRPAAATIRLSIPVRRVRTPLSPARHAQSQPGQHDGEDQGDDLGHRPSWSIGLLATADNCERDASGGHGHTEQPQRGRQGCVRQAPGRRVSALLEHVRRVRRGDGKESDDREDDIESHDPADVSRRPRTGLRGLNCPPRPLPAVPPAQSRCIPGVGVVAGGHLIKATPSGSDRFRLVSRSLDASRIRGVAGKLSFLFGRALGCTRNDHHPSSSRVPRRASRGQMPHSDAIGCAVVQRGHDGCRGRNSVSSVSAPNRAAPRSACCCA